MLPINKYIDNNINSYINIISENIKSNKFSGELPIRDARFINLIQQKLHDQFDNITINNNGVYKINSLTKEQLEMIISKHLEIFHTNISTNLKLSGVIKKESLLKLINKDNKDYILSNLNNALEFYTIKSYKIMSNKIIYKLSLPNEFNENVSGFCSICHEDNSNLLELDCTHIFHKNCILKSMEFNNKCPICRSTIPPYIKSFSC
jgi:hypothetical protein